MRLSVSVNVLCRNFMHMQSFLSRVLFKCRLFLVRGKTLFPRRVSKWSLKGCSVSGLRNSLPIHSVFSSSGVPHPPPDTCDNHCPDLGPLVASLQCLFAFGSYPVHYRMVSLEGSHSVSKVRWWILRLVPIVCCFTRYHLECLIFVGFLLETLGLAVFSIAGHACSPVRDAYSHSGGRCVRCELSLTRMFPHLQQGSERSFHDDQLKMAYLRGWLPLWLMPFELLCASLVYDACFDGNQHAMLRVPGLAFRWMFSACSNYSSCAMGLSCLPGHHVGHWKVPCSWHWKHALCPQSLQFLRGEAPQSLFIIILKVLNKNVACIQCTLAVFRGIPCMRKHVKHRRILLCL